MLTNKNMADRMAALDTLVGKEVWFRTQNNDINSGIVERVEGMGHACVNVTRVGSMRAMGTAHPHANDIYLTKADLIGANYELFEARIQGYKKQMADQEGFVRFCYSILADIKSGSSYEMKAAVRERAMELFGIEADPEAAALEKRMEESDDPIGVWAEAEGL